jgi:hypothetical protein
MSKGQRDTITGCPFCGGNVSRQKYQWGRDGFECDGCEVFGYLVGLKMDVEGLRNANFSNIREFKAARALEYLEAIEQAILSLASAGGRAPVPQGRSETTP